MEKERLRSLDIAKGIAIILVVMGHAIPDATTKQGISSESLALLHSLIYSFHMPLFFLISGYFVNTLSTARSRKAQVWRKFQRLMVPYIFVGLAYAPCKLLLSRFANDPFQLSNLWKMVIGVNPDGELWFLYSLFVISAFAIAVGARVGKKWIVCSLILGGGTQLIPPLPGNVLFYQFFFFLGIYIRQNASDWIHEISFRTFALCGGLWAVLAMAAYWGSPISLKLLTGTCGSIVVLYLSQELAKSSGLFAKTMEMAGHYCMEIYILSDIIKIPFRILLWSKLHLYYTAFAVCTVMATTLPVVLKKYVFARLPSVFNFLFFGEKK